MRDEPGIVGLLLLWNVVKGTCEDGGLICLNYILHSSYHIKEKHLSNLYAALQIDRYR